MLILTRQAKNSHFSSSMKVARGYKVSLDVANGIAQHRDSLIFNRLLVNIFGIESQEYLAFKRLAFTVNQGMSRMAIPSDRKQFAYERDLELAAKALKGYLVDLEEEAELEGKAAEPAAVIHEAEIEVPQPQKVFISHAGLDVAVVTELILLLRALGLRKDQIFCTSVPGYKIPLGTKNYLDAIKNEILDGAVVIFLLSNNFYKSPMCLAEMGAAWVLDSDMIPMVIPPFSFKNAEGVIPFTQGMPVNDKYEVHALAKVLGEKFGFSVKPDAVWEADRDRILAAINAHITASAEPEQAAAAAVASTKAKSRPAAPTTF